jgi:hypothetical protein
MRILRKAAHAEFPHGQVKAVGDSALAWKHAQKRLDDVD